MVKNDFQGISLSRLGFGCMRFRTDPATGEIDQKKVDDMFDLAIRGGVNYFDTAYPYLGGKSELAMAKALSRYPRDSYYVADKFPGHSLPGPVDNVALFNVSLEKCGLDYFDFYLLHNITEWSVKIYESEEYHILPDLIRMKEEGKIRRLGFSFHGGPALLEEYLDRHPGIFDFVQIQLNYLDWTLQDAKKKYDILTSRGLGIWVMEPCRGGKLASLPEDAHEKLQSLRPGASDASFSFRFLLDLPNVKMILSGMNETDQVKDNLETFAEPRPLSDREREALFAVAEAMKKGVPCTGCRYCTAGCPMKLDIPYLLECYNDFKYASSITPGMRLDALEKEKLPSACIGCRKCARACPQGIDIPSALKELAGLYESAPRWAVTAKPRQEAIKRDLHMN